MDGLVSPNPICDMIRHNSLQCVSLYVVIISDFTSIKSYNGDTLYETAVLLSICPRKCIGGGSGRERWGENALPVQKRERERKGGGMEADSLYSICTVCYLAQPGIVAKWDEKVTFSKLFFKYASL